MKTINLLLTALAVILFTACNNDDDIIKIPASEGAVLEVGVGGPTQPNYVCIDLSTDTQSSVNRGVWDLGFYNGDKFSVTLNASAEVMARSLSKSSFDEITPEDYEGLSEQMTVDAIFSNLFGPPPYPEWMAESAEWIDDPEGDLNKTAIAPIDADNNENEIYLLNRGFSPDETSRGDALLVKVTRNGSGYTLEFQVPGSDNIESVSIEKNATHNFVFYNFDTGVVEAEPEKHIWDIAFTNHMEELDVGGGTIIPYTFQDYVVQNRNGVTISEIELEDGTDLFEAYEAFTLGDVASAEFDDRINTIGGTWRTVASPTPGTVTGVREDGFYVVKDAAGNQYKLLFTGMLSDTGERGFPEITYELLK
jgi:hypothetical protein